jgi:hypothetical protein
VLKILAYAFLFTFVFSWTAPLHRPGTTPTPAIRFLKPFLALLLFFTAFTGVNLYLAAASVDRESAGFFHLFSLLGGAAAFLFLVPTLLVARVARSTLSPSRTALASAAAFFVATAILALLSCFPSLNWW